MTIEIRLFSMMAQHAGTPNLALDVPDSATPADVMTAIMKRWPQIPWPKGTMFAVNQDYVPPKYKLKAGDVVAIIPPVSGG